MRLGSRYLESRKLAFFVGEQLALFGSFVTATFMVGRALGQQADWFRIFSEAAVVTTALQIGLYLADLYDFGVAWRDAPRAERLLKTLGATRKRVAGIFSVEFLVLGAVAGLMGSLLATAFSALLLKRWLDADFRIDVAPNLICIVLTALVANAAGWMASFRILGQKPLEVLRAE